MYNLVHYFKEAEQIEIICQHEDETDQPTLPSNATPRTYMEFLQEDNGAAVDPNVYHLGNNEYHAFVYREFMRNPGIAVLHDLSLHHLMTTLTLKFGRKSRYLRLLEEDAGELGRYFAYQREKNQASERLEFTIRLIRQIVERATAVVTHSKWGEVYIRSLGLPTPVYHINHYSTFPEHVGLQGVTREEARQRLGLEQSEFIVVAPGFATRPKKIDWLIDALQRAKGSLPPFQLILAGDLRDRWLDSKIRTSSLSDAIKVTGYLSDREFFLYLVAADVVSVLRYPSVGESSGVLMQSLGFGRYTIIIDYMAFSDIPDEIVGKVRLSRDVVAQIAEKLISAATNLQEREEVEAKSERFARDNFAPERSALLYEDVCSLRTRKSPVTSHPAVVEGSRADSLNGYISLTLLDKFQPIMVHKDEIATLERADQKAGSYASIRMKSGSIIHVTESFEYIRGFLIAR